MWTLWTRIHIRVCHQNKNPQFHDCGFFLCAIAFNFKSVFDRKRRV